MESEKEKIARMLDERKELQNEVDGYFYFYPSGCGAYSSANLRVIADILDERNRAWDEEVKRNLEKLKDIWISPEALEMIRNW